MKKIFTIFATLLVACCAFAQEAEIEEPIIIVAPDTFVNKQPYSFTDQGITISVTQASSYPADHDWNSLGITYFAVTAGYQMTISAEQPIKGVAINGWVKKSFTASSDHGMLSYLSDDDDDATGEPVLTISDIDNTSVTLSCDKQLRCFSLEVYFTQNPEAPQEGGDVIDTIRFVAVTAEAADYSDDELYSSEGHYSYWLKLAPQEVYPHVWLDMYSAVKGDLSGEYSLYNFNVGEQTYVQLGADSWEYEYAYDQAFTITKTDAGYHVEGYIICQNDYQYEFVYDGPIELAPVDDDDEQGIEQTTNDKRPTTKLIQGGQLLILRGDKTYTLQGQLIP
ncbi:MAG: hypothetical protein IJS82_00170 [Paludibacteraceae bacterium]|nr:hypothetical protein [Paludibacteraceae bacterium]